MCRQEVFKLSSLADGESVNQVVGVFIVSHEDMLVLNSFVTWP